MASLALRTGTLGRRLAAHLLRRATFGPTRAEIDLFAGLTADQAVNQLLNFPPIPAHPEDPQTGDTWVINGRGPANSSNVELKYIVNSWWLHQIFDPALPLSAAQKMVFFLHTSFTTSLRDIDYNENFYYTIRLFMHYATGSYKELAYKICLDNGMNNFLDIGDSIVGNPNENFAREFFELFTIGKGPQIGPGDYTHYTEQDVLEAARLLTGFRRNDDWADTLNWDPDTGMPRAIPDISRHDTSDKFFSPAFQNTTITGQNTQLGMFDELSDFVDMIFDQDATAEFICRRLYRFFVHYQISAEVEQDIIQPLAATLRTGNYEVIEVLRQLLKSQHFYDDDDADLTDETIGSLIKSPLELQVGIIRYFGVPIPNPQADLYQAYVTFYRWGVQSLLTKACFDLFAPDQVAGYEPVFQAPEYNRLWISAKSIPARYAMADEMLTGAPHMQADIMAFVSDPAQVPDYPGADALGVAGPHPGSRIADHLVSELLRYLLPESVPQDRFEYFLNDLLLDNLSALNWMFEWDAYAATGDDTNVKPQIQKLIRGILQSPEYQLG